MRASRLRPKLLLVTGGSGFLGQHIVGGPGSEPWQVVAPSSASLDLRNRASVVSAIHDWRPTAIVHTAYRRDDRTTIVDATHHVAEAAAAIGARLVHVSTDVVFPGGARPYTEADPPSAVHEYGRAKLDAERAVERLCPSAVIVRISLLLGVSMMSSHERAVRDAITGLVPMTFFTDEVRCPALVDDVAVALTQLAGRRDLTGPLHLGGPDALSRAELARLIARRYGWDPAALELGEMGESRAERPDRVVLDSTLAARHGLSVRGPGSW